MACFIDRKKFCATRVLLVLALCPVLAGGLAAQNRESQLIREAGQRIRELQAEADALAAQTGTVLGSLRALELDRQIKAEALRKAEAALDEVTTARDAAAARLKTLEAQRVAGTPGLEQRLVDIYKRGRGGYVRLLFAADDLRAFGRTTRGIAAMARLDRVRIDEHRRLVREEREAMAELDARHRAMSAAQAEAAAARRSADAAVAAHNQRLDALDRQRDLAAQYVGELQQAAAALQQRLAGVSSEAPASLPLAPFRGALDWPVTGRVVSRFGPSQGRLGTPVVRNGIEIAAPAGTAVRAVHGGTVTFAAPFTGYGTLVLVDHGDNAFTLYGHLQQASVSAGTRVARGSVVGRTGRNPDGDEVLYFEVRIDGRPADPVQWLRSTR